MEGAEGREYSYGSRSGGVVASDGGDSSGDLGHVERTATGPQRHRAALKIQSLARGRLGRRELGAMKEAERIGHLRRRGLPPNEDFREAGNKLRAEIKQSRYLVAMKEKRIEQLERAAEDAKTEEELRRQEMASLQRKLDLERDEVKGLEVKLGQERDSARALEGTLEQRDKELARCRREMKEQAEALEQAKKMLSRRDKTIARKDEQIANMSPDTEDVCLSARSFSENMMISLRDDAIEAKEKQLGLLNGQNEDLSANITRVESEVEKMQKDMIEKDAELTRRRKKITHQANQIDRLERALQKKGGEEAAIQLTNKQNANLLVLLQQHETKTEALEEARTELEEALAGLRQRHEDLMKTSARFEAQVVTLGSEVEKYKRDLTTGAMEWTGQRAQMTAELEETTRVARVRIDAMQEELRTRREKQYSMLSRLQAADEALRASQDESEQLRETASVVQERLFELEAEMAQQKAHSEDLIRDERQRTQAVQTALDAQRATTSKEKEGQTGLKQQLQEMAATILKLVDKNKEAQQATEKVRNEVLQRDSEMRTLEQRVANLIREGTKNGKARVKAETTAEVMQNQLESLRRENSLMHEAVRQSADDWEARNNGLKKRLGRCKARLSSEQTARRNTSLRYVQRMVKPTDEDSAGDGNIGGGTSAGIGKFDTLNLSNCGLSDSEVKQLSRLFGRLAEHSNRYQHIDLSYNRITDDGARELTGMLQQGTFASVIDLSGNLISGDGVRMLADSANQCQSMGVKHVYVHQDAKVQALGNRPAKWEFSRSYSSSKSDGGKDGEAQKNDMPQTSDDGAKSGSSTIMPDVEAPGAVGTVLTIDCRNNAPPTEDDLGAGLSKVSSDFPPGLGSGSSILGGGRSAISSGRSGSKLGSHGPSAKTIVTNRLLEKAYGSGGNKFMGGSSILNGSGQSSILSSCGSLLDSTSSIEMQAAAAAGAAARAQKSEVKKRKDRREMAGYQKVRKGNSKKKGKGATWAKKSRVASNSNKADSGSAEDARLASTQ